MNLISSCDGELKTEVIQTAAYYEHRLQLGQKAIYHLEAFVAKFMAIYKRFLEEGIADIFWVFSCDCFDSASFYIVNMLPQDFLMKMLEIP